MNVPQNYEENKPLGTWVMNQRIQYKLFKANKTSPTTREQIQSLDELGFEWEVHSKSYTWEECQQQLVDFKDEFDHTNVPQRYAENKPLGSWAMNQRIQYKLFKASKKSSMTRDPIESLEKLGFELNSCHRL